MMVKIVKNPPKAEKIASVFLLSDTGGAWEKTAYVSWAEVLKSQGFKEEIIDHAYNESNIRIFIASGDSVWIYKLVPGGDGA
jgi:hypothetical protein